MSISNMQSLAGVTNDLWDRLDFWIFLLNNNCARSMPETLLLKSEDMITRLESFKSKLLATIEYVDTCNTRGDVLWDTFKNDVNNMCSLLTASMRITFVHTITCSDIDRLAVNLFNTTEDLLKDWTDDFNCSDFVVDSDDVWRAYAQLLSGLSLFCDSGICKASLQRQYDINIQPTSDSIKSRAPKKTCKKGIFKKRVCKTYWREGAVNVSR